MSETRMRRLGFTSDRELVDRANDVSIFDVLEDLFDIVHPREGRSYKDWCPFRWEHGDQFDKGWRTYPSTNTSYCFILHGLMRPVRLYEMKYDLPTVPAAKRLLDRYDLLRPKSYRERFREIQADQEVKPEYSGQAVVEALQARMRRVPGYIRHQFDPRLTRALEARLEDLDGQLSLDRTDDIMVRTWYEETASALVDLVSRLEENGE